MKLIDGVYNRKLDGYTIVATDMPSRNHGGVEVFYRASPRFYVEALQQFGTNIVKY